MVRAVPVALRAAASENPRLMIALIAVTNAQRMNGAVISKSYDVSSCTPQEGAWPKPTPGTPDPRGGTSIEWDKCRARETRREHHCRLGELALYPLSCFICSRLRPSMSFWVNVSTPPSFAFAWAA